MGQLRERAPQPKAVVATGALFEAWEVLRRYLESRSSTLTEEVRHYPTPIARCDEQLGKLLDQRAHVLSELRQMAEQDPEGRANRLRPSLLFIQKFIESYDPSDDENEMYLVAGLRAALLNFPRRT